MWSLRPDLIRPSPRRRTFQTPPSVAEERGWPAEGTTVPAATLAHHSERCGDMGHAVHELDTENPRVLLIALAAEDGREHCVGGTVVGQHPVALVELFRVEATHCLDPVQRLPHQPIGRLA